jgi:sigma-E factor negative regulatory protein RseB
MINSVFHSIFGVRRFAPVTLIIAFVLSSAYSAASAGSAAETDASVWLEKMNRALREETYHGTFIYLRGAQLETIEVVHQVRDGEEFKRLTSLSGEEREIIRENQEIVCYHVPGAQVDLSHGVPMGPYSQQFSESLTANQSMYRIELHGTDRIAGRTVVKLRITPRNQDRYGYQLWLDEETGLLLRSDLVNRGRVLELFQFSQIEIGNDIAPQQFVSSLPDNAIKHLLTQPTQEIAMQPPQKDFRVAWLPNGFRRVRASTANGMAFTDGVATLSVFFERNGKSNLGNMHTSVGGTVVLTRTVKGSSQQITVVGEIPLATARKVADSIEPVIY